jgi:hypothetical protein
MVKSLVILTALLVCPATFFAGQIPTQSLKVTKDISKVQQLPFIPNETFTALYDMYRKIAFQLKNEYVIGYRSTNQAKDGKWRKVQLKVDTSRGLSKVNIRGKTGYSTQ